MPCTSSLNYMPWTKLRSAYGAPPRSPPSAGGRVPKKKCYIIISAIRFECLEKWSNIDVVFRWWSIFCTSFPSHIFVLLSTCCTLTHKTIWHTKRQIWGNCWFRVTLLCCEKPWPWCTLSEKKSFGFLAFLKDTNEARKMIKMNLRFCAAVYVCVNF